MNFEKQELSTQQKMVLVYIAILVLGMVLPGFLPAGNPVKVFLTRLGTNGLFLGVNALMCFTFAKGHSIQDVTEAMRTSVSWDIYFLVGTALCISPILTSADTGIGVAIALLVNLLLPRERIHSFKNKLSFLNRKSHP